MTLDESEDKVFKLLKRSDCKTAIEAWNEYNLSGVDVYSATTTARVDEILAEHGWTRGEIWEFYEHNKIQTRHKR